MKGRFQHRQGRGANCGGGFQPRGLVTWAAVVMMLAASSAFAGVPAVNFWFDDFNDGNATDGSPLVWTPHPATPGSYDASTGDYEMATTTPGDQDESLISIVRPESNPSVSTFSDMSIRTRGVLSASAGNLLVGARLDFNTVSGFVTYVDHGGQMALLGVQGVPTEEIAIYDPPDDGPVIVDALTDVVLQLDAIGSAVSATFWRPGEPQPDPILVGVPLTVFASGDGGLVYNEDAVDPPDTGHSSGIYRWAKALDQKLIDGDMDLDGDVDFDDIDDFVQGLNNAAGYEAEKGVPPVMMGDTDNDGDQDFDDIGVFVTILSGSSSAGIGVPEPSTFVLAGVGVLTVLGCSRRSSRSSRARS